MIKRAEVQFVLAVALSLSIGWGIRGNFGHEIGAMIPGVLAALSAVILSGRVDWLQRVGSFALFGAIGWSFGGSISYMQVIAYTHSGHSLSVWYGFSCLFLIGFLWAVLGGVGTALPAVLSRTALNSLYPLTFLIFAAWCLQDLLVAQLVHVDPAFRQRDPLYWYDTDWLGISVALAVTVLYSVLRRTFDFASRLVAYLCVGWWAGFALFVLCLHWRMTPPRGDNWAGCLGMAAGLGVFLARERLYLVLYSGMIAGIWGGVGFALADFLKLLGISTGLQTNWHSVLEQTYGLLNGVGVAAMMLFLRRSAPKLDPDELRPISSVAERCGIWFVVVGITYLNLQKNVEEWVKTRSVPAELYGIAAHRWFDAAYLLAAALGLLVLFRSKRAPGGLLASSSFARVQLLYLVFLWWIVTGNFERALVGFASQRLITEGVIYVDALVCTGLILLGPVLSELPIKPVLVWRRLLTRAFGAFAGVTLLPWLVLQSTHGDKQIGYASRHIRFGPNATATSQKPSSDKPHP